MEINNNFNKLGYLHVKNALDKKVCNFLTSALLLNSEHQNIDPQQDVQVPNSLSVVNKNNNHVWLFDTLLENIWPILENCIGEELIPTYCYARLYQNGNILEKHIDREACEISLTLQLGRSHHYSWPIFVNGERFDLEEGDAVIYKGCEVEHWREECKGPRDYYSGQVFLHYVRANGQFKEWAGDKRWEQHPFKRDINFLINNK